MVTYPSFHTSIKFQLTKSFFFLRVTKHPEITLMPLSDPTVHSFLELQRLQ
jgi:hypothetical protein